MILLFLLHASIGARSGQPRHAWAAWDTRGAGSWIAVDRFSTDQPAKSLKRLTTRLFPGDGSAYDGQPFDYGPMIQVPAAELYRITDECSSHGKRKARKAAHDPA
jgi:hypothetical protein